ncbi:MAG TPA: hypothetical protein PLP75_01160 [Burkholderiales bacterium]|nr:hypothetical protein [Burkholderiales bacterium]
MDNAFAARVYDVWPSLSSIRSSRTPNGVNVQAVIDQLDAYLVQYKHTQLTENQKSKIT